jgi:transcriptional regulator with XRE-family HTH domain
VTLGSVIRSARQDVRMSQEVLALKLGWAQSQVSRIETSDRDIGVRELIAIAWALEINPYELLRRVMEAVD